LKLGELAVAEEESGIFHCVAVENAVDNMKNSQWAEGDSLSCKLSAEARKRGGAKNRIRYPWLVARR